LIDSPHQVQPGAAMRLSPQTKSPPKRGLFARCRD